MENEVNIREFCPKDKKSVIKILRLNTPQYFAESEENDLIEYLDKYIEKYFVIELNDRVVGCGGFNFAEDNITGKISWDILDPNYQGKGLGTLLLKHRIEKLNEYEHISKITVRTSQLVYKFYEKCGFKLTKTEKDYWAEGYDLYQMDYQD